MAAAAAAAACDAATQDGGCDESKPLLASCTTGRRRERPPKGEEDWLLVDGGGGYLVRVRDRSNDVAVLAFLPWCVFCLLLLLFLYSYHDFSALVWPIVVVCFALSLVCVILGAAARHAIFLALGSLCLASSVFGASVGLHLNTEYLEYYWLLRKGPRYRDVLPLAHGAAAATADAGVIDFANGTFVDDRRTVGFVAGGHIYCVAPIAQHGQSASRARRWAEYWATGVDCCEKRLHFDCGDSREWDVRGGVAARPSKYVDEAIAQARSVYAVGSPPGAGRVVFARVPEEVATGVWNEAFQIAMAAALLHLTACAAAGALVVRAEARREDWRGALSRADG